MSNLASVWKRVHKARFRTTSQRIKKWPNGSIMCARGDHLDEIGATLSITRRDDHGITSREPDSWYQDRLMRTVTHWLERWARVDTQKPSSELIEVTAKALGMDRHIKYKKGRTIGISGTNLERSVESDRELCLRMEEMVRSWWEANNQQAEDARR